MAENQREKRGRLFRKAVESLGLDSPVTEISDALRYDKGNISKILNNKIQPSTTLIKDFQRVFKINIKDFDIPEAAKSLSMEDQIAIRVRQEMQPLMEKMTADIIDQVKNMDIEVSRLRAIQEELKRIQEATYSKVAQNKS